MSARCEFCIQAYGDTGRPGHFASDPGCAFPYNTAFTSNNWNCAALNKLRTLATVAGVTERDNSQETICSIRLDNAEGWLVMTWYKERGRVQNATVLYDNGNAGRLTVELVEKILTDFASRAGEL